MKVVAVGSEPNTLVAALLLARSGHAVQLLTGPHLGGIAHLLGNAPLDQRLAGKLGIEQSGRREGRLGINPEGQRVSLRRDGLDGQVSQRDKEAWPAFQRLLDDASELWRSLYDQPAGSLVDRWRELGRRQALEVLRLPWHSLRDLLDEWFESELLKATLASAALFGSRQGPFASGTAFLLLQRWARGEVLASCPAPLDALSHALLQSGVAIQRETAARFELSQGLVQQVHTHSGRSFEAEVVVSGADPVLTWGQHLPLAEAEPEVADALQSWKAQSTTGTADVDAGGFSDHALVSLTDTIASLEKAYDPCKYGGSSEAPFGELETAGQRVWVQHLVGKGSEKLIDPFAKRYGITALDKMSPDMIERAYLVSGGHLYGGDPVLWQSGWLRECFQQPLPNLYLCGPGVGRGDYSGLNGERCARQVLEQMPALLERARGAV
jgi:phytoene dehydrogenase-like protein